MMARSRKFPTVAKVTTTGTASSTSDGTCSAAGCECPIFSGGLCSIHCGCVPATTPQDRKNLSRRVGLTQSEVSDLVNRLSLDTSKIADFVYMIEDAINFYRWERAGEKWSVDDVRGRLAGLQDVTARPTDPKERQDLLDRIRAERAARAAKAPVLQVVKK
jgi:hypothetical protein